MKLDFVVIKRGKLSLELLWNRISLKGVQSLPGSNKQRVVHWDTRIYFGYVALFDLCLRVLAISWNFRYSISIKIACSYIDIAIKYRYWKYRMMAIQFDYGVDFTSQRKKPNLNVVWLSLLLTNFFTMHHKHEFIRRINENDNYLAKLLLTSGI